MNPGISRRGVCPFVAVLAVALLAMTGCASGDSPGNDPPIDSVTTGEQAPAFEGPWADWFTRVYRSEATTESQRSILEDGEISEQEYSAVRSGLKKCLEDLGITVTLTAGGGYSVSDFGPLTDSQVNDDAVPECEQKTVGMIAMLYEQMHRNPDNKDEASIMVACLRRTGVVADSYTPAQYTKDLSDQTGLDWTSAEVRECSIDPLGILN